MTGHDQPIYDLILQVRATFNALKAHSDAMIQDLGVTAAMRAVLEILFAEGPNTVPRIAEAKSVTRQHIQMLADALAARELVRFAENPGHKRSKLLDLTGAGRALFTTIREREASDLARLAAQFDPEALTKSADLLRTLRQKLSAE